MNRSSRGPPVRPTMCPRLGEPVNALAGFSGPPVAGWNGRRRQLRAGVAAHEIVGARRDGHEEEYARVVAPEPAGAARLVTVLLQASEVVTSVDLEGVLAAVIVSPRPRRRRLSASRRHG
jgi:hypothetical protein